MVQAVQQGCISDGVVIPRTANRRWSLSYAALPINGHSESKMLHIYLAELESFSQRERSGSNALMIEPASLWCQAPCMPPGTYLT